MSYAINSHILTSIDPCINQAIQVLLMHKFLRWGVTKIDVINNIVGRSEHRWNQDMVHTGKFVYNSRTYQGLLKDFPTVFKDC